MTEKQLSKYFLNLLAEEEDSRLAVTDKDFKVTWSSKGFRQSSLSRIIKGKNVFDLFDLDKNEPGAKKIGKPINIKLPAGSAQIVIKPLPAKAAKTGYFIKLTGAPAEQQSKSKKTPAPDNSHDFQSELQQILTLLAKETSLSVLEESILAKCVNLSDADLGFVQLAEEGAGGITIIDEAGIVADKDEVIKDMKVGSSFINKWLIANKRALLVEASPESLGYSLTQSLQCEKLVIIPCFFEGTLVASILIGKRKGSFSDTEIENTEKLASLLAFAISSSKTRELNAALESRLLQAQKLETIGKLASGMAHDFSNLLSSIFGSLNLLKRKVPEREDVYRLLDNIENCSIRAKDLTKGLLSYGKPTPKRKELIKPNQLLNEISKVISQTFPKKINFESSVYENLYDMLGNGTEIYQVLLNLCVNAKEAIENTGTITLNAKNITVNDDNNISYPLLDKGNYVNFSVSDTGTGIDEENLQKIFDPYFSTKGKETGSGSGLGLYVTYGIIKAHNGHIEVSSKKGAGTIFDVYIPSYEPTKQTKPAKTEKIIVLADDEIMLRDLLAELLESYDYNVIRVVSGAELVKVLTEEIKVDLAVVDFNMPEMNGLESIQKIRELGLKIPVILSTGSINISDDFDPVKYGINSVLSKPYEFETMLATIQKLI